MSAPRFRLGKKPARFDNRTLCLRHYLLSSDPLPTPLPSLDLTGKVSNWGLYQNDKLGDCTYAGPAHMIELWTAMQGQQVTPDENEIVSEYRAMSPNDDGCAMLDVLNAWRQNGIAGSFIDGYSILDLSNHDHLKLSLELFGGADLGTALPNCIWDQGSVWDVAANDGGLAGYHCICLAGFNAQGIQVVSWGQIYTATWAFVDKYFDEQYACLFKGWKDKLPAGCLGFEQLERDLAAIGAQQ